MSCLNYCNTIFQRVDDLPSLVDATRNHAYITPDNKIYIINADGSGYMQMSTNGGGVTVGLSSNDGSITIVETKNSVTHTFDVKVSDDIINRIIALENKQDKDTVYDDSVLETKINDLLDRVTQTGAVPTAGNGLSLDGDTLNLDIDWLANNLGSSNTELVNPVLMGDRIVLDVRPLKTKLQELGNKQSVDNDKQTLSLNKGVLSISNGNDVNITPYSGGNVVFDNGGTSLFIRLNGNEGFKDVPLELNHADLMYYLFGRFSSLNGERDGQLDLVRDEQQGTYKLVVVNNQQNDTTTKYSITHGYATNNYGGTTITMNTNIPISSVSDLVIEMSSMSRPIYLHLTPMTINGDTINDGDFQIQVAYSDGFYSITLHNPSKNGGTIIGVASVTYRKELSDSPFDNVVFTESSN